MTGDFANDWVNNQTPNEARIELELMIDGDEFTIVKTRGNAKEGRTILLKVVEEAYPNYNRGGAVNEILEKIGARPGEQEVERMNNQVIGEFSLGYWLRRVWIQ